MPDHAGVRDLLANLVEAERAQVVGHDLRGAHLAVAELGVLVEVAAPGDDAGFDGVSGRVHGGVEREGRGGSVHGGGFYNHMRRN
jgi:hypothetical protein